MITHYIFHLVNGQIVQAGSTNNPDLLNPASDETFAEINEPIEPGEYYWRGRLIAMPEKPGPYAVFNYKAGKWKNNVDVEAAASEARGERSRLLTASDWTQQPDAPVDQAAWAAYRQALRDVPEKAGFPFNITWPVKPE